MTEPAPDHLDNPMSPRGYDKVPVVGLGGSAGAIRALQEFLPRVRADCGLAFVVVIHLAPEQESSLAEVLQRSTSMPVRQVVGRAKLEANHVYVIPPGKAIRSVDG